MPVEQIKEATKVIVEASGSLAGVWQWIITAIGGALVGLWSHLTGRLKKLEETVTTQDIMREHAAQEEKKFDALFASHRIIMEEVTIIGKSVARIEGKLSNNHDWQDEKK